MVMVMVIMMMMTMMTVADVYKRGQLICALL